MAKNKGSKNSKMVSTFLGIFLLVLGIGTGVVLVTQPQLLEEHAQVKYVCPTDAKCKVGSYACNMTGYNHSDVCVSMPADKSGCPAYTQYKLADDCSLKLNKGQEVYCDDRTNNYGYNYGTHKCTYFGSNVYYRANYYCSSYATYGSAIRKNYMSTDKFDMCPNMKNDSLVKTCSSSEMCFEDALTEFSGLITSENSPQIYNPGGTACVPEGILDAARKRDALR